MGPTARRAALALLSLALIAGCGGDSDSDQPSAPAESSGEPVQLSFWSWAPNIAKVVDIWNEKNPDIQVKVSQPAQGDDLMTKLITASKAGNAPDLAQAEYQALPSLLMSEVVADISDQVEPIKGEFSDGTWGLVTFGDAVYGIPQDVAPMMLFYRKDLFKKLGLEVPKTWDEFAAAARRGPAEGPGPLPDDLLGQRPRLVRRALAAGRRRVVGGRRRVVVGRHRRRRQPAGRRTTGTAS